MPTSALLRHRIDYLRAVRSELAKWMEEHEHESIRKMVGRTSLGRGDSRANYKDVLRFCAMKELNA